MLMVEPVDVGRFIGWLEALDDYIVTSLTALTKE